MLVQQTILAEVKKELAQPRLCASARRSLEALVSEKFGKGELVHNPQTQEDGLVSQVYESNGQTMYEVWVPVRPDTWLSGHYVSDWAEIKLELSDNVNLKTPEYGRGPSQICFKSAINAVHGGDPH